MQYKPKNREKEQGGKYKNHTDDGDNVSSVAIADPSTHPGVGEGSHTSTEKDRVEEIHGFIVP